MNGVVDELVVFDLPVLAAALLALAACGTLGNWLVLRRESMTGDAIAHAVLPGLVGGFIAVGRHSVAAMFVGAAIAGLCAILLSSWVRRHARLDPAAALGIVFTAFFALGVTMLEWLGARQVDLDPDCVLFGSLERMFLVPPPDGPLLFGAPRELWSLAAAAAASVLTSALLLKELRVHAFDPDFARVSGAAPRWTQASVDDPVFGLFHFANAGETSRFDFAKAAIDRDPLAKARLEATTQAAFAEPAPRPPRSPLDTAKLRAVFDFTPEPWRPAVERTADRLVAAGLPG